MENRVAIIGAGVSGLTCGCLLAENGLQTTIFTDQIGLQTTSGAAGAIWFPYDVEPFDLALTWALESYHVFEQLCRQGETGISMIELRQFCRAGTIPVPEWATELGASAIVRQIPPPKPDDPPTNYPPTFADGFSIRVPLIDTTIYLDYLAARFRTAGGKIKTNCRFETMAEVPAQFSLVVNCAGIGARTLVPDSELEPHRGQVVLIAKLNLSSAVVCDDAPLMYAIPRANDCLLGGTNEVSDDLQPDPAVTTAIVKECSRVLGIEPPDVLAERVGLRPFRRTGVRLESERSGQRVVIHNYGHGGAGFTLSWGCAQRVLKLVKESH